MRYWNDCHPDSGPMRSLPCGGGCLHLKHPQASYLPITTLPTLLPRPLPLVVVTLSLLGAVPRSGLFQNQFLNSL